MPTTTRLQPATLRTIVAAIILAVAVHLTQSRDLLEDPTRPVVMTVLRLIGLDAVDRGEVMAVGGLHVPWTRDCAGINLLLILLALAVWVNRQERRAGRFWLRVACMVPAALAANVLRVLTLLAYRTLAYPGVESPQTHYFMGFMWLVPFVALITPRDDRPKAASIMETLHAAAVISLLAPMTGTPNATLVALATVACLSRCRVRPASGLTLLAWSACGIGIAMAGMESFWLPWLLLCPQLVDLRRISIFDAACIACTHSLIAMQTLSWTIAAVGVLTAWLARNAPPARQHPSPHVPLFARVIPFFAALPMPFIASTLLSFGQAAWTPPASLSCKPMNQGGYEVRLRGQPPHVGLACYAAASRDRHHTVQVCLKYRGIEVTHADECPLVLTEGRHWFREFFLQDGQMLPDYAAYVRSTFRPWSDPGVHLIFVSLREKQTAAEFSAECDLLATQFHQLCTPQPILAHH